MGDMADVHIDEIISMECEDCGEFGGHHLFGCEYLDEELE